MKRFEDHIKNRLKNHRSPVDTDALWNSISEDIPKGEERKKRGLFFLFIFGLGITGGIIFIYSNPSYQKELATYFHTNAHTLPLAEDIYYENNVDFQHYDMMPPVSGNHSTDEIHHQGMQPSTFDKIIPIKQSLNTSVFPNIFFNNDNDNNKIEQEDNSLIFASQYSSSKAEIVTIPIKETTNAMSQELLAAVDLLDAEVVAIEESTENIKNIVISNDDDGNEKEGKPGSKERKKVKVALGFTTGYSSSKAKFSTDLAKFNYYASKRSRLEEHKGTMTLSGDVVLSFSNNMRFRTGVEYTRLSELFSYYGRQYISPYPIARPELTTSSSTTSINRDQEENNGGSSTSAPSNSNNTIRELDFQSTNRHHFIDIPLIAGYEIGKKKVSLLVEAGLNINVRAFSEGYVLLHDASYAKLTEIAPFYNKNVGMSTYTGLSLNYDLGNNTQLKLGGHFKMNPFSLTRKDNVLKQKYHSTGIHIGILHQL